MTHLTPHESALLALVGLRSAPLFPARSVNARRRAVRERHAFMATLRMHRLRGSIFAIPKGAVFERLEFGGRE